MLRNELYKRGSESECWAGDGEVGKGEVGEGESGSYSAGKLDLGVSPLGGFHPSQC